MSDFSRRTKLPPDEVLRELCRWTVEHLDALQGDEDAVGLFDETGVLSSLRCIVTGDLGCTEEDDYSPAQWAALTAIREALGV